MYEFPICELMAQIGRYQSCDFHQDSEDRREVTLIITLYFNKSDNLKRLISDKIWFEINYKGSWIDQTPDSELSAEFDCLLSLLSCTDSPVTIEWVGADEEKSLSFVTVIWKHQFGAELPEQLMICIGWTSNSQSCQYIIPTITHFTIHYILLHSSQYITTITHFTITDLNNHFQKHRRVCECSNFWKILD